MIEKSGSKSQNSKSLQMEKSKIPKKGYIFFQ